MKYTGLEKMIKQNHAKLCSLEEELEKIKGGALHVRKRGDRYYYWEYDGNQQVGITRNKRRIYQLARKRYLEKEIKTLKRRCDILTTAQKGLEKALENDGTAKVREYYENTPKNNKNSTDKGRSLGICGVSCLKPLIFI